MTDPWRLERLFRDAWPARDEVSVGGWLARLTGGDTRRPNSINPAGPDGAPPLTVLDAVRERYADEGLRPLFRVPAFCPAADADLARAGWISEGHTHTLAADLAGRAMPEHGAIALAPAASPDWVAARVGAKGDPATEALLARIACPAIFVTVYEQGTVAAIGYAALDAQWAVIESIRTVPAFQGRGLGTVCVGALLAASARAGARTAALQVDAANAAGLALYARLGFDRRLYDYHYRATA